MIVMGAWELLALLASVMLVGLLAGYNIALTFHGDKWQ